MGRQRDAEAELNLPPGFRFHPTDEELIVHYLCRKAAGQCLPVPIIAEIDLYKFDPWQLPDMALFGQREWYFFTPRDRKYPNGSRPNRAAGKGYWKATGADKPILPKGEKKTAGIKKALVFYSGKAPGRRCSVQKRRRPWERPWIRWMTQDQTASGHRNRTSKMMPSCPILMTSTHH